jgi:hypothetical protein
MGINKDTDADSKTCNARLEVNLLRFFVPREVFEW